MVIWTYLLEEDDGAKSCRVGKIDIWGLMRSSNLLVPCQSALERKCWGGTHMSFVTNDPVDPSFQKCTVVMYNINIIGNTIGYLGISALLFHVLCKLYIVIK